MTSPSPCILCGADRIQTILTQGRWHYQACCNCGLVALHPRPSLQTLMHNYDAYLPDDTAAIRQWEKLVTPVVDVSAELIADRMPKTGRLLDVGCGFGFFMERMWRAGWSVEGIEVSATGRCYARQRWGFDIHPQPLEELALAKHRYDVVTLFYVIEHVDDPIRVLKTVNTHFKTRRLGFVALAAYHPHCKTAETVGSPAGLVPHALSPVRLFADEHDPVIGIDGFQRD